MAATESWISSDRDGATCTPLSMDRTAAAVASANAWIAGVAQPLLYAVALTVHGDGEHDSDASWRCCDVECGHAMKTLANAAQARRDMGAGWQT